MYQVSLDLGRVNEYANVDDWKFFLDGRCVEFPDGIQTSDFTHTIHRFPGKFVPQVARELLRLVGATGDSLILDPFCGSGTSLIEASVMGVPFVGVDIDPLSILLSKAKTTAISPSDLVKLDRYWSGTIGSESYHDLLEQVPNLDHWFKPAIAEQLAFLKKKALYLENEDLRIFSLVVLSSIVRRVSNADDQTQKTYVSGTLKKTPPLPSKLFPNTLHRAITGMERYVSSVRTPVTVRREDARTWQSEDKVDGIITSPPYIDSIDYIYNQMLEYFWLYDVLGLESVGELRRLRKEPVGFRRVDVDAGLRDLSKASPSAAKLLEPILSRVGDISKKEAQNIIGYFLDFLKHLMTSKTNMKKGGIYALVVGESYIRGVTVPTPAILSALFGALGFESMGTCSYVIKRHYMKFPRRENSRKIKIDHVCCYRYS